MLDREKGEGRRHRRAATQVGEGAKLYHNGAVGSTQGEMAERMKKATLSLESFQSVVHERQAQRGPAEQDAGGAAGMRWDVAKLSAPASVLHVLWEWPLASNMRVSLLRVLRVTLPEACKCSLEICTKRLSIWNTDVCW